MNILRSVSIPVIFCALLFSCKKETGDKNWIESTYTGSYKNIVFTESLIGEYGEGVYPENSIPSELKQLEYGRIEIDFRYNGGGLYYFSPLFYYGSINKNESDDSREEPQFHLAVEIGHYNVIPVPVENLFYTICTYNYPQYCRDTYYPVLEGTDYTAVIDRKPEGMRLQLKKGDSIISVFPYAFFPDSSQMFFKDVTAYTDANKGDSLQVVMMVGKGFAGIERGIHDLNGSVSGLRIYQYSLQTDAHEYELLCVRNQHTVNQKITYRINDRFRDENKLIVREYEYWPYLYESGAMVPVGAMQTKELDKIPNNKELTYIIKSADIGFYKIHLETVDENGALLGSTAQPFEIWIYPGEWEFEFY